MWRRTITIIITIIVKSQLSTVIVHDNNILWHVFPALNLVHVLYGTFFVQRSPHSERKTTDEKDALIHFSVRHAGWMRMCMENGFHCIRGEPAAAAGPSCPLYRFIFHMKFDNIYANAAFACLFLNYIWFFFFFDSGWWIFINQFHVCVCILWVSLKKQWSILCVSFPCYCNSSTIFAKCLCLPFAVRFSGKK